jgi:hypothetical protein
MDEYEKQMYKNRFISELIHEAYYGFYQIIDVLNPQIFDPNYDFVLQNAYENENRKFVKFAFTEEEAKTAMDNIPDAWVILSCESKKALLHLNKSMTNFTKTTYRKYPQILSKMFGIQKECLSEKEKNKAKNDFIKELVKKTSVVMEKKPYFLILSNGKEKRFLYVEVVDLRNKEKNTQIPCVKIPCSIKKNIYVVRIICKKTKKKGNEIIEYQYASGFKLKKSSRGKSWILENNHTVKCFDNDDLAGIVTNIFKTSEKPKSKKSSKDKFQQSSVIEQISTKRFVCEIQKNIWDNYKAKIGVLFGEVDAFGYDLVLSLNTPSKQILLRHIQLKSTVATSEKVSVNTKLRNKTGGCLIWHKRNKEYPEFHVEYLFYGDNDPNKTIPPFTPIEATKVSLPSKHCRILKIEDLAKALFPSLTGTH